MKQTNIRMTSLLKKRLQRAAIEKEQSLQDTILEYIVLGLSVERNLETNETFTLPMEFEIIKATIERDL